MSSNVIHLESSFEDIENTALENNLSIVLKFSSKWCLPCKVISPLFEELSKTYEDKGIFLHVDVEEHDDVAEKFNVRGMPTFIVLKPNNKGTFDKVGELVGANTVELKKLVSTHLV